MSPLNRYDAALHFDGAWLARWMPGSGGSVVGKGGTSGMPDGLSEKNTAWTSTHKPACGAAALPVAAEGSGSGGEQ
jgi:hypothetical protein